jgi:hypothetical protein
LVPLTKVPCLRKILMLRLGNRFHFVPSSRSMSPIIARHSYWFALLHALRADKGLSRPDTLPGFLEVLHRLFEDGVFVGHEMSIRAGILRSPDCFAFSRAFPDQRREVAGRVPGFVLRVLWPI